MKTIRVEVQFNIPDEDGVNAVVEALRAGAQQALAVAMLIQPKGKPAAKLFMDDMVEGIQPLVIESDAGNMDPS